MSDQVAPKPAVTTPNTRLPGGADALREVHGDWLLIGTVQTGEAGPQKTCVIAQEQIHNDSRQRLLLIELRPQAGRIKGTLILPFGLSFQKGVVLQVDDNSMAPAIPFRTAVPMGCVVELDIDALRVALLKAGKILHVHAIVADTSSPIAFAISLNGFATALTRAEAVLR
ncbi:MULTISPECIES: invasion associated locus B family protein [unclassified Rhizobium]|jgi:invasion protein IalB|uniref:invasion associated locus B family protein n=1 Tax=unclassified Rhizobium TaxID=2613769 RepID=UPI000689AD51|nr:MULTISPECIES: invasion associated locus B family protein [unclassified Rhizobium]MBN8949099.1 invasion associated locus B family protein [Rhizobium tropici]OJY72047.1 MAG: hypothetical protein BGP09_25195 [Rhizobium sp. 60-20]RKD35953.1 invasion protein IalB [Rhizobium sp. WW_1]